MNLLTNLSFQLLYMDPSAVSILLTSITAIVLSVGASLLIYWKKIKNKVQKTFKIDPNSGKEVEDDIVITDSEEVSEGSAEVKTENASEQKANDQVIGE